ncbi:hypothetical protein [Terrimonas pollutisoli]|uniref:hypothetical protein n=1 Tax=Terrimonas pollutisoli TaxID=3034147 RepID=UPI0023EBF867|nr:hypothetical protein [Terrimonas sp. H1YJ31]
MNNKLKQIRGWVIFFMVCLFLSGLTAIPLEAELQFLSRCFSLQTRLGAWIEKVYLAIVHTNRQYPFLSYGYDWLAFAHFVLAILFIGPLKDPVKNKWVIEFAMIACLLIIPYAFIAGQFRGIPIGWRLIDCSFGIIGLIPLSICLAKIKQVENFITQNHVV